MNRYLLSSAVITAPGRYEYTLVSAAEAREWSAEGPWESAIGYGITADLLSSILRVDVPVRRIISSLEPGDEALVCRITHRVDPALKSGEAGAAEIARLIAAGHFELGILRRLPERAPQPRPVPPPRPADPQAEWPWFITPTALRQFMSIAGLSDEHRARQILGAICVQCQDREVGERTPNSSGQLVATIRTGRIDLPTGKRRLELSVVYTTRTEGAKPQLLRVRDKGH